MSCSIFRQSNRLSQLSRAIRGVSSSFNTVIERSQTILQRGYPGFGKAIRTRSKAVRSLRNQVPLWPLRGLKPHELAKNASRSIRLVQDHCSKSADRDALRQIFPNGTNGRRPLCEAYRILKFLENETLELAERVPPIRGGLLQNLDLVWFHFLEGTVTRADIAVDLLGVRALATVWAATGLLSFFLVALAAARAALVRSLMRRPSSSATAAKMRRQPRSRRLVSGYEIDAGFHHGCDEGHVAGQPVQLGNK